jgi:tetratricopeptide (TPR) repeat protein
MSIELAEALMELGRYEETQRTLDETYRGMEASEAMVPPEITASLEVTRADFYMLTRRSELGRTCAQHALQIMGDSGPPLLMASALDHLGWLNFNDGDLSEAERSFSKGAELCRRNGLTALLAYHINGLGYVELQKGNMDASIGLFLEAAEASRRAGDILNASIHGISLAEALHILGRNQEAEAHALEALKLCEKFDFMWIGGKALLLLGRIDVRRGRWGEAKGHFSLAIDRLALSGEQSALEVAKLWLALVRGETGDPQGALKATEGLSHVGSRYHLIRARLHELVGDLPGAKRCLERAWDDSAHLRPMERAEVRAEEGRIEEALGNKARAEELRQEARRIWNGGPPAQIP